MCFGKTAPIQSTSFNSEVGIHDFAADLRSCGDLDWKLFVLLSPHGHDVRKQPLHGASAEKYWDDNMFGILEIASF